jgi:hypothetical protein
MPSMAKSMQNVVKPPSPEQTKKILEGLGVNSDFGLMSVMASGKPLSFLDIVQREVKILKINI